MAQGLVVLGYQMGIKCFSMNLTFGWWDWVKNKIAFER